MYLLRVIRWFINHDFTPFIAHIFVNMTSILCCDATLIKQSHHVCYILNPTPQFLQTSLDMMHQYFIDKSQSNDKIDCHLLVR